MQTTPSVERMIEEQIRKWQIEQRKKYKNPIRPVITLSRLPGALGGALAGKLSEDLNIDLFDQQIVEKIAANADVSKRLIETLDEQDRSVFDEWISALGKGHLWSYQFLQQLTNVVTAIGTHGYAVIVGRGASLILPKEVSLRVLITAPLEKRIRNTMELYKISENEARKQVMHTEAERKSFIRQYFQTDLTDPDNYDIVINTENIDIDLAAETIKHLFNSRHWYNYSMK